MGGPPPRPATTCSCASPGGRRRSSWGAGPADTSLVFDADPASLRVLHGTGGMQPLEDDDKANIEETIVSEVLLGMEIAFRSTAVEVAPDGNTLHVQGELTLVGVTHPIGFDVGVGPEGELTAKAVVKQSDWGMKPYSALFGALKVSDEVEVEVDASEERSPAESVAVGPPRSAAIIDPGDLELPVGAPLRPLLAVRDGRDRDLVGRLRSSSRSSPRSSSSCSSAPAASRSRISRGRRSVRRARPRRRAARGRCRVRTARSPRSS